MNRFKKARIIAGNKPLEVVAKESTVSKNTIWKLENGLVDARYSCILKLANYYCVDVGWVLGKSDSPSLDGSIQTISKTTGLSDRAIENLQILKAWGLSEALNQILEDADFVHVLERFESGRILSKTVSESEEESMIADQAYVHSIMDSDGRTSDFSLLSKGTQADMLIASATQVFGNILRDTAKGGKDNGKHS